MNRKEILERCLESIRLQKFADYEIIVVDNAFSDGMREMVQSFPPDVRYFYLVNNHGVAGGRNYGVRMASGEICFFIDDDACFDGNKARENVETYFNADDQLGCLAFAVVQPGDCVEKYNGVSSFVRSINSREERFSDILGRVDWRGFFCYNHFRRGREI
jgi:glycosyltransferase involved in cell wall biosynthesis